jgi:hypothetical protein
VLVLAELQRRSRPAQQILVRSRPVVSPIHFEIPVLADLMAESITLRQMSCSVADLRRYRLIGGIWGYQYPA